MMPWFTFGQVRIPSYPVMALAGAVISCFIFYKTAASRRWERRSIAFVLIAAFAAFFLGAKLFNAWADHAVEGSRMLAFMAAPSGFSLYGALMGGAMAVFIVSYLVGRNGLEGLDLFALSSSFGCGIGRVGCLLAGCCHGRPTLFPVALEFSSFDAAARPIGVPLHATQVYDMALLFGTGIALAMIARARVRPGLAASFFFLLYPTGRFLLEFLRGNPRACYHGLSVAQWTSILLFLLSLALLIVLAGRKTASSGET